MFSLFFRGNNNYVRIKITSQIYYYSKYLFLFPRPKGPLRWISRAVLGEKIYCAPKIKFDLSRLLLVLVSISFLLALSGAWFNNIYLAVSGTGGIIGFKLWYLNNMVKLYDEENIKVSENPVAPC